MTDSNLQDFGFGSIQFLDLMYNYTFLNEFWECGGVVYYVFVLTIG